MNSWDPDLYLRFGAERTRPARDLAAQVAIARPARVIDLGCGPGNSTAVLRERWPDAEIIGLDSSAAMIAAASQACSPAYWLQADIATWRADIPFDVIFSNAVLQWLPDHRSLFTHLMQQLAPAGALAVQIPMHYDSAIHQLILKVADQPLWRDRMHAARSALTKEPPGVYYDVLQPLVARLDMWQTEYLHVLDSHHMIIEWFRGTGLRPFLDALHSADEQQQFEQKLLKECASAYPVQRDGRVIFPFRRLFVIAYK